MIKFVNYYVTNYAIFKVHIKGQKKVGAWFNYKTELSYKNVSAYIKFPLSSSTWGYETVTVPNYTSSSDEYSHECQNMFKYSTYFTLQRYPVPSFESLEAEYTSRGVGSWGVINF